MEFPAHFLSKLHLPANFSDPAGVFSVCLSAFFPQMEFPALFLSKLHLPAIFSDPAGVFSVCLSAFFPQMEFPALFLSKLHLPADYPASVGVFSIYNYHLRFHLDILNSIRRFTRANILFLTLF